MERFWSTLKLAMVYRLALASHREARVEIFDYIEVFFKHTDSEGRARGTC